MNLKQTLMELGNRLVTEHGFDPPDGTKPIIVFTKWINKTPAAREVLAQLGVEWPVVMPKNDLAIPDFKPEQAASVELAEKNYEANRKTYNDSLDLMNRGLQTAKAHLRISKAYDRWKKALGDIG